MNLGEQEQALRQVILVARPFGCDKCGFPLWFAAIRPMLAAGVLGLCVEEPGAPGIITVAFSQMEALPDKDRCCLVVIQQCEGSSQTQVGILLRCRLFGQSQCPLIMACCLLVRIGI